MVHLEQVDLTAAVEEQGSQNHRQGIKAEKEEQVPNCRRELFHCLGSIHNIHSHSIYTSLGITVQIKAFEKKDRGTNKSVGLIFIF